jgi:hypothetical protein
MTSEASIRDARLSVLNTAASRTNMMPARQAAFRVMRKSPVPGPNAGNVGRVPVKTNHKPRNWRPWERVADPDSSDVAQQLIKATELGTEYDVFKSSPELNRHEL